MVNLRLKRPSPALVVSFIALFAALSGVAIALEANSVRSKHIVDGAVRFSDLSEEAFATGDIDPQGSPTAFGVSPNAIQSSEVSANALTGADIDEGSLGLGAAYAERTSSLALTSNHQTVISREITATGPTQLQATATVNLGPDANLDGDYNGACQIEVDGLYRSPEYRQEMDELDFGSLAVAFGRTVFAGEHTVALECRKSLAPNSFVLDAGMVVAAVPLG